MSRRARAFGGIVALAVIASGVGMCARVAERGRYATPHSSIGAGPDGTRAIYVAAEALGASPGRWTRDLSSLPEGAALLAFGGCDLHVRRPVRRYEAEALVSWVEAGGLLVVAGATGYLPEAFGVSLERPLGQCESAVARLFAGSGDEAGAGDEDGERAPVADFPSEEGIEDAGADDEGFAGFFGADDTEPLPRWAEPASPALADLPLFAMMEPARIVVDEGTPHEVLLTIAGEPAGVRIPHGRGAVVALSAATPFENEWVAEGGAVLLFRVVERRAGATRADGEDWRAGATRADGEERRAGALLFDEYHLGIGGTRSILQYLRSLGAGPLLAQLAVVALLLLYRAGARFGRPLPEPPPRAGGTEPYVDAIGGLYARSADFDGVVEVLRRRALARVAAHHKVEAPDAALVAARAGHRLGEAARAAIVALGEPGPRVESRRAMVERAKEIDALERAAIGERERRGSTDG